MARGWGLLGIVELMQQVDEDRDRFTLEVRRVVDVLEGSVGERPTVEQLAEAAYCHPNTLRERFGDEFGVGPARFACLYAIYRSFRALVRCPATDLMAVAHEVGYATSDALGRAWTRETGFTAGVAARALRRMPLFDQDADGMLAAARAVEVVVSRRHPRS